MSLTVWPPARQALSVAAVGTALVTSVGAAGYADGPWTALAAIVHVVAAALALANRQMLTVQVGAGVTMAWTALLGADGTAVGAVVTIVGVVATSELLAAAGRLGIVIERDPAPELRQVGLAVAVAAATSGVTLAAGALAGPAGLAATAVAALGCIVLAAALRAPGPAGPPQR